MFIISEPWVKVQSRTRPSDAARGRGLPIDCCHVRRSSVNRSDDIRQYRCHEWCAKTRQTRKALKANTPTCTGRWVARTTSPRNWDTLRAGVVAERARLQRPGVGEGLVRVDLP